MDAGTDLTLAKLVAFALLVSLAGATALTHLLKRHGARRGRRSGDCPAQGDVFVRNLEATTAMSEGETILRLPQQREGLALNAVAARCWELMDGTRSLKAIATLIAAEHGVSEATALDEIRSLAARLRRGYYALPAHDWSIAHTHFNDLFAGARDEGISEIRIADTMIVHIATALREPGNEHGFPRRVLQRLMARRARREAEGAFARHVGREAPLREAMKAFESGWAHSGAGRLEEAEKAFLEGSRLAPGWANPHYQLGYVYLRARRFAEALEQFTLTEKTSPGFFMVREYLDLAGKLADGRLSFEAFHLFERASTAEPGDPDLVIALCRKALELSPDFPSARLVLGRAYARKRDYEKALRELMRAINTNPDRATLCNALFARGSIFMARGMSEQAVREFEKVIELNGSPVATRSAMAHLASSASVH